jgi:hypothetical protein
MDVIRSVDALHLLSAFGKVAPLQNKTASRPPQIASSDVVLIGWVTILLLRTIVTGQSSTSYYSVIKQSTRTGH